MKTCNKYNARLANGEGDLKRAQAFRARQFRLDMPYRSLDTDIYDADCEHILIEKKETGELCACFRFLHITNSENIEKSYSAQFYDLSRLKNYKKPMLEIGRFCVRDDLHDQELLRVAWAFLTRYVDTHDIQLLFGCSSFMGTDKNKYMDAFSLLKERYLAPEMWKPETRACEVFKFADQLKHHKPILREANKNMPPLLRSYLNMGGWVSDHAVVDRDMSTLHVFTGVEVSAIPSTRVRLLRTDASA